VVGSYRHGVDAKGRVALPARLRGSLPEGSIVARWTENRLVIWPPAEWEELGRRLRSTLAGAELRRWERFLYASARTVELDAQGRMLLDAEHRRWAQITDRCVFVGLGNRVEIVGEELWDADEASMDPDHFSHLYDLATGAAPAAAPPTA
jgi:MraZ protein